MRRFAKEGRTLEAAYDAWKSLSFDPSKDDMEELINKVVELAEKLGYNEDAQVMAIKSVLPREDNQGVEGVLSRALCKSKDERHCIRYFQLFW